MPRFDGTGPAGQGPMTGRGLGPCGAGRGFGRGGCPRFFPGRASFKQPSKEEQKTFLESELEALKEEMQEIEKELKTFKK